MLPALDDDVLDVRTVELNAGQRQEVVLTAKADAIVALTGGASRVVDAVELLAAGVGEASQVQEQPLELDLKERRADRRKRLHLLPHRDGHPVPTLCLR